MIPRRATVAIEQALARQAAVVLLGPRQVGKTTLALAVGQGHGALYLDLEDPDDRNRLASPGLFLDAHEDRLVILDEIHRLPTLFESLRGIIDRGRRSGKGRGRFLMLGSASLDLMRQSETLAGRVSYAYLDPLNVVEVPDGLKSRDRLWLRGGFPDSYTAASDAESLEIRRDLLRTYLEREVALFGPRRPAETLGRFWTMLAHRQGAPLNAAEFARSLDVSGQSVARYVDLLCDLLLVRRLQPFHANLGKRLVKAPKLYVRDSGLLHALLAIDSSERLAGHPVVGASWEGFVIETLIGLAPPGTRATYYRTHGGAEIDLILEWPDGSLRAIEAKRGLSAKPSRGFHEAMADVRPARAYLVHAGEGWTPLAPTVESVGLGEFARRLADEPGRV